ncbi:hypothetical protein AUJ46_06460 [Candidatus Peregrinibacteria bacterium CG1_02_54_53]|nr:MAG: hypothetical protein AUJ46_06460 [Candidatus Peregrinibacteria bacterium CG1_02_54_53]
MTLQGGTCGDGTRNGTEQCDSGGSNGNACTPPYNSSCTYCSSTCTNVTLQGGTCGDGTRNGTEQCDSGAQNGQTCTPAYGSSCTYCSTSCTSVTLQGGTCGDGTQNGSEQCDSGATNGQACTPAYGNSCTYCSTSCTYTTVQGPRCGDGTQNGSEQCDSGASNGQTCTPDYGSSCTYCSTSCTNVTLQGASCGDGTRNGTEQCDSGAQNGRVCSPAYGSSCTYCSTNCTNISVQGPRCGDGTQNGSEQCDNGSQNGQACTPAYGGSCSFCSSTCTTIAISGGNCGDGVKQFNETCDTGAQPYPGCGAGETCWQCTACVRCGNNVLDPGETCSAAPGCTPLPGYTSCSSGQTQCLQDCSVCGDGVREGNEQCDSGGSNGNACTPPYDNSCTYCSNACTTTTLQGGTCGDGTKNGSEQCDSGVTNGQACTPAYGNSCTFCSPYCKTITIQGGTCGDGTRNGTEQCDSGAQNGQVCTAHYNNNCTYCSTSCTSVSVQGPHCGDGTKNGSEQCDNGSQNDQICIPAYGGNCTYCSTSCSNISVQGPRCGDGTKNGNEQCDSGGSNGNACTPPYDNSCTYCSNACTTTTLQGGTCGDGTKNGSEQCDSGASNGQICTPAYGNSCTYCSDTCITTTLQGGTCGDGTRNGTEQCDGTAGTCPATQTCNSACQCVTQTVSECSDGIDNDQDGKTDYSQDTGCVNAADTDEVNPAVDVKVNGQEGPVTVPNGAMVTVSWTTQDAQRCDTGTSDPPWGPNRVLSTSGSQQFGPILQAITLGVHCAETLTSNMVAQDSAAVVLQASPQCSDGIDNDGDSKIDHPADPDCTSPDDDSEESAATLCLNEGEEGVFPWASVATPVPCCSGLDATGNVSVVSPGQCGNLGATFVCTHCGDGQCEWNENECNCPADCLTTATSSVSSVRSSASSATGQPPICGNGISETGETCGEPSLPSCPAGQVCQSCQCVTQPASSAVSSSASSQQWTECQAGSYCTARLLTNQCTRLDVNCGPGTQVQCDAACGNASCTGECCRCEAIVCGSGRFQSGKQCDLPGMLKTMATGPAPSYMVHGDFNGDNKQDIATLNSGPNNINSISIFLNKGDGSFYPKVDYALAAQQVLSLKAADANGDARTDLIVMIGGHLRILRGNGDGTFQPAVSLLPADPYLGTPDIVVRDFNADGRPDVLASTYVNLEAAKLRLFAGQAGGTLAAPVDISVFPHPRNMIATADFDADGHPDVAFLPNRSSNDPPGATFNDAIEVLYGNGAGGFISVPIPPASWAIANTSLLVRDFNADGRPDLVQFGNGAIGTVWLNNGNRTFQEKTSEGGAIEFAVDFADTNADGKSDAITYAYNPGTANTVELHLGRGDGVFVNTASASISLPSVGTFCLINGVAAADFNGDGKQDLTFAHGNGCNTAKANTDAISVFISPCAPGQTCASCQCIAGSSSSASIQSSSSVISSASISSQSSLGSSWTNCPSGWFCSKKRVPECRAKVMNAPSPPCFTETGLSCGDASCAGTCMHTVCPASSASSSTDTARMCPNGILDAGETCEIGVCCPTGQTCDRSCHCVPAQASSASAVSSFSIGITISSSSASSRPVMCGDGLLEGAEECEMNIPCTDGTSCNNCECGAAGFCGDDTVNPLRGEECEQSADCPAGFVCSLRCLCEYTQGTCGDGLLEGQEQCESEHACPYAGQICNNCLCSEAPRCGNHQLEYLEECEIGEACPAGQNCVNCICNAPSVCGNGTLEANEQCENDAQCLAGQTCEQSTCRCEGSVSDYCGDAVLKGSEECEVNAPCADADKNCDFSNCLCVNRPVIHSCGDTVLDPGEDCDIGVACPSGMYCAFPSCHCTGSLPRCGNGKLEGAEQCEIGTSCAATGEVCDMALCQCAPPDLTGSCGNGLITIGEECEVGIPCPFGWACDFPRCACLNQPVCGDGALDPGEECEINSACVGDQLTCDFSRCRCIGRIYECGNGIRDPGEECDDGNTRGDDGCSGRCQRETIYSYVGGGTLCGNGVVENVEECDDGNVFSGDGCSAFCFREENLFSTIVPSDAIDFTSSVTSVGSQYGAAGEQSVSSIASGFAGASGLFGQGGQTASRQAGGPLSAVTITFPQTFGQKPSSASVPTPMVVPYTYGMPATPIARTGPEAVILVSAGAALGLAWIRRKKQG